MAKKRRTGEKESVAEISGRARLYFPAVRRLFSGESRTEADMQDAKMALKLIGQATSAMNARNKLAKKLLREGKAQEAYELLKGRAQD